MALTDDYNTLEMIDRLSYFCPAVYVRTRKVEFDAAQSDVSFKHFTGRYS